MKRKEKDLIYSYKLHILSSIIIERLKTPQNPIHYFIIHVFVCQLILWYVLCEASNLIISLSSLFENWCSKSFFHTFLRSSCYNYAFSC